MKLNSPENQDTKNVLFNPKLFGRKTNGQFQIQILFAGIIFGNLPLINLTQNCNSCCHYFVFTKKTG